MFAVFTPTPGKEVRYSSPREAASPAGSRGSSRPAPARSAPARRGSPSPSPWRARPPGSPPRAPTAARRQARKRGKAFRQAIVGAVAVGVGGILRKDRQDEVAHRVGLVDADIGRPNRRASRPETSRRRAEARGPPRHQAPSSSGRDRTARSPSDVRRTAGCSSNTRSVPSRAAQPPPRRAPTSPARPRRRARSSRAWRRARSRVEPQQATEQFPLAVGQVRIAHCAFPVGGGVNFSTVA